MSKIKLKHPHALIPLTLCYSLFMTAFGGILASLTLYQTNQLHINTNTAYGVFAAAMALLWILFPIRDTESPRSIAGLKPSPKSSDDI